MLFCVNAVEDPIAIGCDLSLWVIPMIIGSDAIAQ